MICRKRARVASRGMMLAIITVALNPTSSAASAWTREVGPAEAPSGYVEFCRDAPLYCVPHGVAKPQAMDERHWRELQEANTLANHMIEPLSDRISTAGRRSGQSPACSGIVRTTCSSSASG